MFLKNALPRPSELIFVRKPARQGWRASTFLPTDGQTGDEGQGSIHAVLVYLFLKNVFKIVLTHLTNCASI